MSICDIIFAWPICSRTKTHCRSISKPLLFSRWSENSDLQWVYKKFWGFFFRFLRFLERPIKILTKWRQRFFFLIGKEIQMPLRFFNVLWFAMFKEYFSMLDIKNVKCLIISRIFLLVLCHHIVSNSFFGLSRKCKKKNSHKHPL